MSGRSARPLWRFVAVFLIGVALLAGLAHVVSGELRRAVAEGVVPVGD